MSTEPGAAHKALRLPTFLSQYEKVAGECAKDGTDHPRYLLRLAELELIDRERRMIDGRSELRGCRDFHVAEI